MHFFDNLKQRGLLQDFSDEKGLKSLKPGDTFYVGLDPTAPSLQLGNLVPLMVSMHLARFGMRPIILFGGATGAIGDPSGKANERSLLDRDVINSNIANHQRIVREIFKRASITDVNFVNNYDWTKDICILDFLRDVGKHFTVNYMISKEVVKTRLNGDGISYTEFSYMLLQAYDFFHLYSNNKCKLQIGGSDQWGNITAGLEMIRRKAAGEAFAFSIPLVTDSQGKKFGKSEGGTLWLDSGATSPYKLHQFLLNTADSEVIRYLKIFTFLDDDQILTLQDSLQNTPEKREAQNALADQVCNLLHGESATADARRCATVLFGGSTAELSTAQLEEIFSDSPSSAMHKAEISDMSCIDVLTATGLAKSKGEARRLVESGGAYINNQRITDSNLKISTDQFEKTGMLVLRSGKKNYHLLKIQ